MEEDIPFYDASKKTRKRMKYTKPNLNQELSDLWKKLHKNEKHFRKVVGRTGRQKARIQFLATQRHFDKQLRFYHIKYRRDLTLNIETLNTENPSAFWKELQKLGPRRNVNIPMEYEDDDGNIIYDEDKILQNWESAFKNLYTNPNGNFDDVFYNQAILHKKIL